MKWKIILILIILLIFTAQYSLALRCDNDSDCQKVDDENQRTLFCVEGKCVHATEITYPKIGNLTIEPHNVGLPTYVKYIFNFGVAILGIVIFGSLVYNGFLYLVSTGNPVELSRAKSGIVSAFFGALILLGSVMLFQKINPQLTKIEVRPPSPLAQPVEPGVYVCNYKVGNVGSVIKDYLTETGDKREKALENLKNIMWNEKEGKACVLLRGWHGNFKNFEVTKNNTIFIIPSIREKEGEREFVWNYGVILHEKPNQKGKAIILPPEKNGKIFGTSNEDPMSGSNYSASSLDFTARSFTLFKKPETEETGEGVILYSERNFGEGAGTTTCKITLKPDDITKKDTKDLTCDRTSLEDNIFSIRLDPPTSYFAIFFEKENFEGNAVVINKSQADIESAGVDDCKFGLGYKPCVKSIVVIKGYTR